MPARDFTIVKVPGTWVVRAGGAVIGETKEALELTEGDFPPVIYFPRTDIAMAFLDRSETIVSHDRKGEASPAFLDRHQVLDAPGRALELRNPHRRGRAAEGPPRLLARQGHGRADLGPGRLRRPAAF